MKKTLLNMPSAIRASALYANPAWYARLVSWIVNRLFWIVVILSSLSWWTLAYWGVYAFLPFDSVQANIPSMRDFIVATYLLHFCVIVLVYNIELFAKKPLAERGWPCIADGMSRSAFCGDLKYSASDWWMGMAPSALLVGAWMLAASYFQTHGSGPAMEHLWHGVALVGIGSLALLCDRFPPRVFRVPSDQELNASSAARGSGMQQERGTVEPVAGQGDYAVPVTARAAKVKFVDIFGMQQVKNSLAEAGNEILGERVGSGEAPRNGILLHGEPGNGKTIFAEALAGELDVPFIEVTYGDVSSKWIGEMPKVLSNIFKYAVRHAPAVLFVDEIDSFLTSRDSGSNNSEDQKVTNTLLTEIVALRQHQVILVGATNFMNRLDAAAIREGRFDYKVEITPPDEPARLGLLKSGIKKYASGLSYEESAMTSVAKRWDGFSVARLIAVTKAMPTIAEQQQLQHLGYEHWMAALRVVQGRSGRVPKDTKSLGDLVFRDETREALTMILNRLRNAHHVESLGGSLPRGVLFHGLSGAGKTAAARALAKDAGWAFLAVAGPDLVADRKKLQAVFSDAADIRPTLLFIDEADDLLRNRQYSSTPDLCNKLLTLMDGVEGPVRDVVVIAATNNPDQVDPALMRGGRFTEKVEFMAPPRAEVPRFIANWVKTKRVILENGLDAFDIADSLDGQTIANVEGVLQYALNRAIDSHVGGDSVVLARADLETAIRVVIPENYV